MFTRKQLAELYGLSPKTFGKLLREIGIDGKQRLTPNDVTNIINTLGKWDAHLEKKHSDIQIDE